MIRKDLDEIILHKFYNRNFTLKIDYNVTELTDKK